MVGKAILFFGFLLLLTGLFSFATVFVVTADEAAGGESQGGDNRGNSEIRAGEEVFRLADVGLPTDQPVSKVVGRTESPAESRSSAGKPLETIPTSVMPAERSISELSLLTMRESMPQTEELPLPVGMAGLSETEMRSAQADHGFMLFSIQCLTLPEGQPVTRVVMNGPARPDRDSDDPGKHGRTEPGTRNSGLSDESLDKIFAGGSPIIWTVRDTDLAVIFWAPLYERLEPIAAEDELWVPIHRSMIWRRYYDVTMERYGWELVPLDLKIKWGQIYVTGVGLDGMALKVDRVTVDDYKYKPAGLPPFRHSSNEPFTAINTGGRVSWIWRQGYTVHFDKYQFPLTRIASGPSSPTGPGPGFDFSPMKLEDDR